MTDKLQEYLQNPAALIDSDYRNLLRNSLQEVLILSRESVQPVEEQIESRYRYVELQANEEFQKAKAKVDARFQAAMEEARQKHRDELESIESKGRADLGALNANTETWRDHVVSKAEAHEQQAQRNCDYEVMTAENIAEGNVSKYEQERRKIEHGVTDANARLDSLCEQADAIVRYYCKSVPERMAQSVRQEGEARNGESKFREQEELAERHLAILESVWTPRLFVGMRPFVLTALLCGAAVGLTWLASRLAGENLPRFSLMGPAAFAVMLAAVLVVGKILWKRGRSEVFQSYELFQEAIAGARAALERRAEHALAEVDNFIRKTIETRDQEVHKWKKQLQAAKRQAAHMREGPLRDIEASHKQSLAQLEENLADARQGAQEAHRSKQEALQQKHDQELDEIQQRYHAATKDSQEAYDSARGLLRSRWREGMLCIEAMLKKTADLEKTLRVDFGDRLWSDWMPNNEFRSVFRFGCVNLDLHQLGENVVEQSGVSVDCSEPIKLPALLAFPDRGSLLLQTPREGRDEAIKALRAVMVRLFTSLPPGRVNFTIFDPVGLGENFAGFMHAADHHEALVGRRIWTDTTQMHQRLVDLTEHMENVIQKYLRNEFETIEQYNRQAGELAEPYRFLVIADFPVNFDEQSARCLSSIVNSGPRCGVYTLIMYDDRHKLPAGVTVDDLAPNSVHIAHADGRFVWQDPVLRHFPLELDAPPAEERLTQIMHTVGLAATDATRVEVPFQSIAPKDDEYWTLDSRNGISVPVGRTGATRLQQLDLGRGVAQHVLIAGKTGSGKSTLLHVVITNLALWYSPDEIELHLIDFKRGVEFKPYVKHKLPHARTVAIESDREFGLSILQQLDAEMARRGEMFRQAHVQDIGGYRRATGEVLRRAVLIVDEFQVFFAEDDRISQDAAVFLEQLVRQGRAFGIHVLLGSQTLGGASGLARSTMGQMAVRIALQCSEADSQLILDDNNLAARLLSRPGEAIYNDAGGMVMGNSPFQTAWLPESRRDECLERIANLAKERAIETEPAVVFEGNVPADLAENGYLAAQLAQPWPTTTPAAPCAWLGEPVAIRHPTVVTFRRQSGANLLIVGQREQAALGLISAALIGLAMQHGPGSARFVILDGSPDDSAEAGVLERVAAVFPHEHTIVQWRDVPETINDLAAEVQRRNENNELDAPTVYLLVHGLHRYRALRRMEDDFMFSADAETAPRPDRQLAEMLRDGPLVHVHTLIWVDTLAAVERMLDRQTLREFDSRVLFQMSTADSSNLIDSPLANQLGLHRALLYDEDRGGIEKFRPYATVGSDWLESVKSQIANKSRKC